MKKISEVLRETGAAKSLYKLSYGTSYWGLVHCILEEMRLLAIARKIPFWRCPKVHIAGGCHVTFARDVGMRENQKILWREVVEGYDCRFDEKAHVWDIKRRV